MQQRVLMNSPYGRFIRNRIEGSHFTNICRIVTFSLSIEKMTLINRIYKLLFQGALFTKG